MTCMSKQSRRPGRRNRRNQRAQRDEARRLKRIQLAERPDPDGWIRQILADAESAGIRELIDVPDAAIGDLPDEARTWARNVGSLRVFGSDTIDLDTYYPLAHRLILGSVAHQISASTRFTDTPEERIAADEWATKIGGQRTTITIPGPDGRPVEAASFGFDPSDDEATRRLEQTGPVICARLAIYGDPTPRSSRFAEPGHSHDPELVFQQLVDEASQVGCRDLIAVPDEALLGQIPPSMADWAREEFATPIQPDSFDQFIDEYGLAVTTLATVVACWEADDEPSLSDAKDRIAELARQVGLSISFSDSGANEGNVAIELVDSDRFAAANGLVLNRLALVGSL